jgi:hypothetical protein
MSTSAADLLTAIRAELAPAEDANRLVPLIESGRAPLAAVAALAAEQHRVIPSDHRSFLVLAARASGTRSGEFFSTLAGGEGVALATLPALAAAAGMDQAGLASYRVRPGAQAYPAYVAWLALNGDPAEVVLAMVANFAAWGAYCATVAGALRSRYGFDDEACGFFDFFAGGSDELETQAVAAAQEALDAGATLAGAHEYGRLLQSYELMFWDSLADLADELLVGQDVRA